MCKSGCAGPFSSFWGFLLYPRFPGGGRNARSSAGVRQWGYRAGRRPHGTAFSRPRQRAQAPHGHRASESRVQAAAKSTSGAARVPFHVHGGPAGTAWPRGCLRGGEREKPGARGSPRHASSWAALPSLAGKPTRGIARWFRASATSSRGSARGHERPHHFSPLPLTRYTAKLPSQWPPR